MNTSKTSKDYEEAIRAEYEKKKRTLYGGQLLSPSPKVLKELSLLCYDNAGPKDREILIRFYENRPGRDLRKDIEGFSLNRLRTLCMFLRGETGSTSRNGMELIALLVDFRPRPLNDFLKEEPDEPEETPEVGDGAGFSIASGVRSGRTQLVLQRKAKTFRVKKGMPILLAIAAIIALYLSLQEDCSVLVWRYDHYEKYNCEIAGDSLGITVIPFDEALLRNMRKVKVDTSTPFFRKDGAPRIWYAKVAPGKLEFFTAPGLHPETGKTLRPITDYMINKYVYRPADSSPIAPQ